jgi:hypothetical protein
VRARLAFVGAAVAALGALTARSLRRKREQPAETDPRAGELRRRLQESRAVVSEREEFEAAETPVDEVEPVAESAAEAQDVDERRREIHDRARSAAEEMRRD